MPGEVFIEHAGYRLGNREVGDDKNDSRQFHAQHDAQGDKGRDSPFDGGDGDEMGAAVFFVERNVEKRAVEFAKEEDDGGTEQGG